MFVTNPRMSNKLLLGGFLTSVGYLSYKIYERFHPTDDLESNENYLILKRMEERYKSGHLKETPFPIYLELAGTLDKGNSAVGVVVNSRGPTLCQSIQNQLETDWNCFLYKISKFLLQ